MIEVKIPETIKIGGFDYSIVINSIQDAELHSNDNMGECSSRLRRLIMRSDLSPQELSSTFSHEILHAIDDVYGHYELSEKKIAELSTGLFQVLEQLGIRFVRAK